MDTREELAGFKGERVCCTARFADVRVLDEGFINLLFRDVTINGTIKYDHIWVVHNKEFKGKELRNGCLVEFDGVVREYGRKEDRYGISYCKNVHVIEYDKKADMEGFSNIRVKFKTVNYCNSKYGKSGKKGWQEFEQAYGMGRKDSVRLVYSPAMTYANGCSELEFDAYGTDGESVEFSRVSFHPVKDGHKVRIDSKYYVNITESAYRQLALLYFFVTKNPKGCMSYVPKEVSGDYFEILDGKGMSKYYYDGRLMFEMDKDTEKKKCMASCD